ncbi:MAG TPA: hypothetical protein VKP69_18775 [Isosphaeraceae bacterium]|nr:hypothetical protein [Isosphaeraceae bacterium]
MHPDLANRLRRHIAGRGPTEPIFSILANILRRFKADCERAGIALVDGRGRTIDIHALRTSLIDA